MNYLSITISWEKNSDGSTDISVCGEIDNHRYFAESFLTLDRLPSVLGISETETNDKSVGNSATIELLNILTEIIGKSDKQSGHIISEQKCNSKFPFVELVTIRRFAQIAGIKVNEQKFRNVSEFRRYSKTLLRNPI